MLQLNLSVCVFRNLTLKCFRYISEINIPDSMSLYSQLGAEIPKQVRWQLNIKWRMFPLRPVHRSPLFNYTLFSGATLYTLWSRTLSSTHVRQKCEMSLKEMGPVCLRAKEPWSVYHSCTRKQRIIKRCEMRLFCVMQFCNIIHILQTWVTPTDDCHQLFDWESGHINPDLVPHNKRRVWHWDSGTYFE